MSPEYDLMMTLGGGISPQLIEGRNAGRIEKTHLVLKRLLSQQAEKAGVPFIDLGTDYSYPFFENYTPTTNALQGIRDHADSARSYPSSFGLVQLREEFSRFMSQRFGVDLDPMKEVVITTGASQAFDALSRTFRGQYFMVPDLTLSTVHSIAIANGARPMRMPTDPESGTIDLDGVAKTLEAANYPSIRFMYINYPNNPSGFSPPESFFQRVADFAKRFNILVVHDMDTWYLTHEPGVKLPNLLQAEGGKDIGVTILSLSKEFGLPGIRIGLVGGNAQVVNALRIHNSEYCVMLPEPCQHAALEALRSFQDDQERHSLSQRIRDVMGYSIKAWQELGWPPDKIFPPMAGYKYLLNYPPSFRQIDGVSGVELFDYYVASRAYVKLSTSRSFNENNTDFIRLIIMQDMKVMEEVFSRLKKVGVDYTMDMPDNLIDQYLETVRGIDLANL